MKDDKVHCKICNEPINWNQDGSTQLKWHLNSKHELNSALSTPKPKALNCEIESEHEFHDENHEPDDFDLKSKNRSLNSWYLIILDKIHHTSRLYYKEKLFLNKKIVFLKYFLLKRR